ncbi:S8 family serine peptidase [Mycoplasma leonicaptivi]|uniref:S8 family serine peptidase n=1 Tax=Mycoplasma leonicaptivi TaxID=36742 RepID=UPI000486AEDD|nr:S8 family serine peptidase [Mycoplasma leonicaptivi]
MKNKFKKIKLLFSSTFLSIPITTLVSANFSSDKIERNLVGYKDIYKDVWNHLGISETEFSNEPVNIGIIDGGFVDSNILSFNNNYKKVINKNNYYFLKDRANETRVIYNDSKFLKKIDNKPFLNLWKNNSHATQIASIIGSDSGLLKNATFYSAHFEDDLKTTLDFFVKNKVKYVNMSYTRGIGKQIQELFETWNNETKIYNNNFILKIKEFISNINYLVEKRFSTNDYDFEAKLIDEYAFKYNMKFFISVSNNEKLFKNFKNAVPVIEEFFEKHKNYYEYYDFYVYETELKRLKENIKNKVKKFEKNLSIAVSKNTFVIGGYNIKTKQTSDFSDINYDKFNDSPLGLGPNEFNARNIVFDKSNPEFSVLSGTSYSTPIILAMSVLLEKRLKRELNVAELKAILVASFKNDNTPYNTYLNDKGYGLIDWKRMKVFGNKTHKITWKDFKNNNFEKIYELRTRWGIIVASSNLSTLFEKSFPRNQLWIDYNESDGNKYISPFNLSADAAYYASMKELYDYYHLTKLSLTMGAQLFDPFRNSGKDISSTGSERVFPRSVRIKITIQDKENAKKILDNNGLYIIVDKDDIDKSDRYVKLQKDNFRYDF